MKTEKELLDEAIELLFCICSLITSEQVYVMAAVENEEDGEKVLEGFKIILGKAGVFCQDQRPDLFE